MTDLIIGAIFVSFLVGVGVLLARHSNKVRREMFDQMDEDLGKEAWWEEKEPEPEPEKPKPAPKKKRGRPKKNG